MLIVRKKNLDGAETTRQLLFQTTTNPDTKFIQKCVVSEKAQHYLTWHGVSRVKTTTVKQFLKNSKPMTVFPIKGLFNISIGNECQMQVVISCGFMSFVTHAPLPSLSAAQNS